MVFQVANYKRQQWQTVVQPGVSSRIRMEANSVRNGWKHREGSTWRTGNMGGIKTAIRSCPMDKTCSLGPRRPVRNTISRWNVKGAGVWLDIRKNLLPKGAVEMEWLTLGDSPFPIPGKVQAETLLRDVK